MKFTVTRGAKQEYEDETGRKYFSVSQVRAWIYNGTSLIPPDVLETARKRGTILHQRFWRVLASQVKLCDVPAVVPGLEGYCKAMDDWAAKRQVEPIQLETQVANVLEGYAGQLDAIVAYGEKSYQVLTDLKTGQRSPTDKMQLFAYEAAIQTSLPHPNTGTHLKLMDLYLFANGSYHEEWLEFKDKLGHFPVFMNALSILRWRHTLGL